MPYQIFNSWAAYRQDIDNSYLNISDVCPKVASKFDNYSKWGFLGGSVSSISNDN